MTSTNHTSIVADAIAVQGARETFLRTVVQTGRDDLGQQVVRFLSQEGGEPMRDQLRRAEPGEELILASHALFAEEGPFREFGPVYVSSRCEPLAAAWREVFENNYFSKELVLRRYDDRRWIADARRVETSQAAELVEEWLSTPDTAFVDARFPEYGCFACRFVRTTR